MKMYKVTNKTNDVRKFLDRKKGKHIFVSPNKYVLTNSPPIESDVWKVENNVNIDERRDTNKMKNINKINEVSKIKE
jgi:hypothetical protein